MKAKSFYIFLAGALIVVSLSVFWLGRCCHHDSHGYSWQGFKQTGCQVFGTISQAVRNHDAAWPSTGAMPLAVATFVTVGVFILITATFLPLSRRTNRGWPPLRLAWQRGLIHPKIY